MDCRHSLQPPYKGADHTTPWLINPAATYKKSN